ncbi:hypothetical protein [Leifsonia shinshuensis]
MAEKRSATFAEIVAAVKLSADDSARSRAEKDARPGALGRDGALYDRQGLRMTRSIEELGPAEAADLVRDGAGVAFEGCGCGGATGCAIEWAGPDEAITAARRGEPVFVRGHRAPTWIDLWQGDGARVVFLHGDVTWGDLFA